ncbi:NADP-dependent oxidoreductase [Rhodobacteraceae bacterium LMO-12]|nr:NADP-dependent oxidoreductase [Rhodobacteraceae bacterium LMO-JJ12]
MTDQMQCITLAQRPVGAPKDEDFKLETRPVPTPGDGEVLVRVHYMSLDPYMRGRMNDAKSYADPVPLGGMMEGGGAGEVLVSNHPQFSPGDMVFGMFGWTTHGVQPGNMLRKLDTSVPITTSLGVLGMPGFTGWYGLTEIGKPKKGETLVVAAATGPVGQMVGQIAKARGLRTVAIAGGADKCKLATEKFGFDAAVDHRAYDDASSLRKALAAECPDGIDIYFENVGGKVFEAVLPLLNRFARIPVCGMIAGYNATNLPEGPDRFPVFWSTLLVKHLTATGFIISNHFDRFPDFAKEVVPMLASGELTYLEDIVDGLENAPRAFMGLLEGKNVGKLCVKVI